MTRTSPYQTGLDRNAANHVPLSPLSFLGHAAAVFPERVALIHGELRQTWRETEARCRRLASALARHGVPMAGGVLNTRLDAEAIAFMLEHGEARVLLVDPEFATVVGRALQAVEARHRPLVIDVLHRHPAVMLASVVALPDAKWGEVPCAYVELKPGASATEDEIVEFCRGQLARFKVPKRVVFAELPKTSTGKIQKFVLRERAKSASAIE